MKAKYRKYRIKSKYIIVNKCEAVIMSKISCMKQWLSRNSYKIDK